MEFKYQFLENKLNTNTHPLKRAVYRHIEALTIDWIESGAVQKKKNPACPKKILEGKINSLLIDKLGVPSIHPVNIGKAVDQIKNMYAGVPKNSKSKK